MGRAVAEGLAVPYGHLSQSTRSARDSVVTVCMEAELALSGDELYARLSSSAEEDDEPTDWESWHLSNLGWF